MRSAKLDFAIPYQFKQYGFEFTLLSVKNNFSKRSRETLISAEYEDQYGHTRVIEGATLLEFCTDQTF